MSPQQTLSSTRLAERLCISCPGSRATANPLRTSQVAYCCGPRGTRVTPTCQSIYLRILRKIRVSHRARTVSNPSAVKHLRTPFHSFPGSHVFCAFYELGTGVCVPPARRTPKASSEIRDSSARNLVPSTAYGAEYVVSRCREHRQPQKRRNLVCRAKIKTASVAPTNLGNESGLPGTARAAVIVWPQGAKEK